jgi:hypothetical protein
MIYWSSRYVFTPYALIIEGHGVKGSFTRSAYLSKNKVFGVAFRESWVGFCFFLVIVIPMVLIGQFILYILPKLGISYFAALGAAWTFAETIWVGLFIVFNVLYLKSLASKEALTKVADDSSEKNSSLKFHPAVILFPIIDLINKLYIPLSKAIFEKLIPLLKSFFEKNGKFTKDVEELNNRRMEKVPDKETPDKETETFNYLEKPESEHVDAIKISFIHRLKSFFKFPGKADKFPKKEAEFPIYFEDEELKDRKLKKMKKLKKKKEKKVPDKKTIKTVQYFEDDG